MRAGGIVRGKPAVRRVVPPPPLDAVEVAQTVKAAPLLAALSATAEEGARTMAATWCEVQNGNSAFSFSTRWSTWAPLLTRSAARILLAGVRPEGFVRFVVARFQAMDPKRQLFPKQVLAPGAVDRWLPIYLRSTMDTAESTSYRADPLRRAEYHRRFSRG